MTNGDILLKVKDLQVSFRTGGGEVQAVRDVSFDLHGGETLAIVGESASGKSVTAKSIMRLLPADTSEIKGGEVIFGDRDLLKVSEKEMEGVRGPKIAMIFQDPMTSLDPTMKVGRQITEALGKHLKLSRSGANKRAVELLQMVGIPNPEERVKQYPHQFSGGMRQRVVIAIALACEPDIIIADEPTTALDVTIQAQILDLLRDLQERKGTSIILITHDLGVVANTAHRVAVMYSGRLIETGTVRELFYSPKHPYTWGLLTSVPLATSDGSQELIPIQGSPPDPLDPPQACPFAARCPHTMKICVEDMPEFTDFTGQHRAACWLHHEMAPHVEPPARVGEAK
ncbi:MAG: ABC transporter ATP-binding protein [Actinomycetota bacterium]|nr:ABC transporter ATP-binding protein [Actinomycetota bacterium]